MGTEAEPGPVRQPALVLVVVGVGTLLSAMAGSMVTLALPSIGREMGISIEDSRWVMQSYLLASGVMLLPAGRLGDLLGHGRVYLAGFLLFGTMAAACGAAPSFGSLLAGRVLQGVGGALVMATGPALITTSVHPSRRGRALGLLATATYVGLTVGPPLGGFIVDSISWRWTFYLNAPVVIVVLALGWSYLPRRARPSGSTRLDWAGVAAILLGTPLLLLALSEGHRWGAGDVRTLSTALAGAAAMVAFVVLERRREHPLLDLGLFRSRVFTGAVLSAVANYTALFIVTLLLPFFLEEGLGRPPASVGALLSVQPLVMALCASPAGWLSDRIGSRLLSTAGMLLLAIGLAALSTLGPGSNAGWVAGLLAVVGLGVGTFISPNSNALMGAAPRHQQGSAGSVLAAARIFGMLLGVTIGTTVYHAAGGRTGRAFLPEDFAALHTAMLTAAAIAAAGAVAAAMRGRPPGAAGRKLLAALALCLLPGTARAYSITLSSGTPSAGVATRWNQHTLPYYLHPACSDDMPAGACRDAVRGSLAEWTGWACSKLRWDELGFATEGKVTANGWAPNGLDEIVFVEDETWLFGAFVMANTSQVIDPDGLIHEADIAMNGLHVTWAPDGGTPGAAPIPLTLVHEVGHFIGLAHAYGPYAGGVVPVMTPFVEDAPAGLTNDDATGLCFLAPASTFECIFPLDCPAIVEIGAGGEKVVGSLECQASKCGGLDMKVTGIASQVTGEGCSADAQCASGLCAGGEVCAPACGVPGTLCPDGTACVMLAVGTKMACLPLEIPLPPDQAPDTGSSSEPGAEAAATEPGPAPEPAEVPEPAPPVEPAVVAEPEPVPEPTVAPEPEPVPEQAFAAEPESDTEPAQADEATPLPEQEADGTAGPGAHGDGGCALGGRGCPPAGLLCLLPLVLVGRRSRARGAGASCRRGT